MIEPNKLETVYKVGDQVESVGGNFTKGTILEVAYDESYDDCVLKIKWTNSVKGPINFIEAEFFKSPDCLIGTSSFKK